MTLYHVNKFTCSNPGSLWYGFSFISDCMDINTLHKLCAGLHAGPDHVLKNKHTSSTMETYWKFAISVKKGVFRVTLTTLVAHRMLKINMSTATYSTSRRSSFTETSMVTLSQYYWNMAQAASSSGETACCVQPVRTDHLYEVTSYKIMMMTLRAIPFKNVGEGRTWS